jgi:hypothetical protein
MIAEKGYRAMRHDQFGYEISVSSPTALAAWDKLVLAFLAHAATTPEHLGTVLSEAPEFAMAHATKGLFLLMLGRREMNETAQEAYRSALACAREGNPTAREMGYVRGLGAWLDGRPSGAGALARGCAGDEDRPRDPVHPWRPARHAGVARGAVARL